MGHSRGDRFTGEWRRSASLLGAVSLVLSSHAVWAGTWIWTGLGCDDNWSTTDNWNTTSGKLPSSDYRTTLIFDGSTRLAPEQDIDESFQFGNLVFSNNAGAFCLMGTSNIFEQQTAWRSLQFSGSNTFLTVLGGGHVAIRGALVAPDDASMQTITVASGMTLQTPWIHGGQRRVVVKKGAGLLQVFEHADGQYYLARSCIHGPEFRVEDGLVEIGTRTNRIVRYSENDNWKTNPAAVKVSYNLTVGDGLGGATSAVFRLIGPAQQQLMEDNLTIAVNADGLLDFNGVQDWDPTNAICLSVSNGLVRMGGSSLLVRNGKTLELRGAARVEGAGANALVFYDGATNSVDDNGTRAVLAADAALSNANCAGVVFQVADKSADPVDLEVTGHLGGRGYGSHLIKRGAGTMSIMDLTHEGNRTNRVEEGTLWVNGIARPGDASLAAQWLVATNATLGGVGIISNATVVVQGGTLDPGGTTAGTLTIESNLVIESGSTLAFDIGCADSSGTTHDQVVIQNGMLTGLSNAVLRIKIHNRADVDGRQFRIVSGGGDLAGQSFRQVVLTGRNGRRAEASVGQNFVDVRIHNTFAGTGIIVR